jgi:hypothetical protein
VQEAVHRVLPFLSAGQLALLFERMQREGVLYERRTCSALSKVSQNPFARLEDMQKALTTTQDGNDGFRVYFIAPEVLLQVSHGT